MMNFPDSVDIVEVGPRDGLQSEQQLVTKETKIELVNRLNDTGLATIEVGSFVSPKWIPQMADSAEVFQRIEHRANVRYPMLVPNLQGLENALAVNADYVAIFAAASETFSKKNINCSIAESLDRYREVVSKAAEHKLAVRGYISCIAGCPYEGNVAIKQVVEVAEELLAMGCDEIAIGDTIGVGTPNQIKDVLTALQSLVAIEKIGVHFHDTYGQALANCLMALSQGVRTFDSAIAGLGGCPYAKGASGNLATEDLVYMLHGMGIKTGVDLDELLTVSDYICSALNKEPQSKVALAYQARACEA